jgi:GNAT superfamily N-acetyltransferase
VSAAVTVRSATASDEDAVLDLLEELFDPPGALPSGYARERGATGFRWAVASPDADVLLALDGERVVGFASVYLLFPGMRFGRRCWVEELVVTRAVRSRGVGRRLLDAAAAWGRARGCAEIGLASAAARKDAHRFYRRSGMAESMKYTRPLG